MVDADNAYRASNYRANCEIVAMLGSRTARPPSAPA
jgi:hypothetical protein